MSFLMLKLVMVMMFGCESVVRVLVFCLSVYVMMR